MKHLLFYFNILCFRPHFQVKIPIFIIILALVGVSLWLFVYLGRILQLMKSFTFVNVMYYYYYLLLILLICCGIYKQVKGIFRFYFQKRLSYYWRFIFFNFLEFFCYWVCIIFYSNEVCVRARANRATGHVNAPARKYCLCAHSAHGRPERRILFETKWMLVPQRSRDNKPGRGLFSFRRCC